MKLLDLHIDGFGKFHNRDVSFSDGLNIIYGKNEAGKSTIHSFVRCMLFGLERGRGRASKNDTYSHYEPWDNKAVYGGRMRVEQEGFVYRIERNFQKNSKSLAIINETLGKQVEPSKAFLDQLLCGLSETTYANTISIGQLKSVTDSGMVSELRNFIANMNTTGNMSLNVTRATSHLRNRRKDFDRLLNPDAAKNYTALLGEIRSLEQDIAAPKYENLLLPYQNKRAEVQNQIAQKQEERGRLLQKIAAGRQALDAAQFTDEDSVAKYRDDTKNTYDFYQAAKSACQKKSRPVLAAMSLAWSLLLGAVAIAMAVQQYRHASAMARFLPSPQSGPGVAAALSQADYTLPLVILCGILSLLFAAVGALLIFAGKRGRKDLAYTGKLLQEVFSRHLGDGAITDSALEAFLGRMEEYIRLSQVMARSHASLDKQAKEIDALKEQVAAHDEAISRQQKSQWELEKKLDRLAQYKDQVEALKQVLEENDRIREEIAAIDLALDTMTELSSSIRGSFGLYLNKTASDMIGEITGGVYDSLSVDENLNLFMNTRTKLVPVGQISSGAMDQVYLALRLAAAKLVQSGHDQMPLIFDDSFVQYDDDRLRATLKWLSQSYSDQIILFTCHQREAQMMTANQIPYHMITI